MAHKKMSPDIKTNKKDWRYLSNLKPGKYGLTRNHFSRPHFMLFVAAFAIIGFLVWHIFASSPLVASMEAEQMSLPTGASIISDSLASGGKAVQFTAAGQAHGVINFPSTVTSVTVNAKAAQCAGSPTMTVAVGTVNYISTTVSSTSWSSYSFSNSFSSGTHDLYISASNLTGQTGHGKHKTQPCPRTLYADVTYFYGPAPPPPPAPTVTLAVSPTSVTAGQSSTLTWASTNANACNASGAWSGAEPTSGSTSTGALNQTSTYSLTCTGDGGNASASATVTVTSGGGGSSSWFPTPPSTYSATGTFTKNTVVDTATGTNPAYSLYYTFRRMLVRTSTGTLFMVYDYVDSNDHSFAYWRLKESTDGGSTWKLVRDSQTAGDPNNGGVSPALEVDGQDNVYVIVSQYKSTDPVTNAFKFSPSNGYTTPTIFRFGSFPAANKWSAVYDQTRNWIWVADWEPNNDGSPDLLAFDQNGNVKVQKQVMIGDTAIPNRHAHAEYVFLDVTPDGTLIRGWSGTGEIMNQTNGPLNFYDVRYIYSPDAGTTWYNANGPLVGTAYPDDTGPTNRSGTNVTDLTPGVEFIPATDSNYWPNGTAKYNYNNLANIAFNGNALHFFYYGNSASGVVGTGHHPYVRVNWSTKAVDVRQENLAANSGTTATLDYLNGAFIRASSENGPLFFIGNGGGADYQHIVVLKSTDNGTTWTRYAVSGFIGSNPVYTNAARWIYSDGKIYGMTVQANSPNSIYFFEISPN